MKPLTAKLSREANADQPSVQTEYWDSGLGAAGCIFIAKSTGRILLAHRNSEEDPQMGYVEEPDTWATWGGKIDSGESPKDAVVREVEEETGYDGEYKLAFLWTYEDKSEDFQYHNYLAIVADEFLPERSWENDRGKWVEWGEWPHPMHFGLKALLQHAGEKIHRVVTLIKRKKAGIVREMDTPPPAIVKPANATANYNITNAYIVATTLWGESRGEGENGMQAVMNVIMNRAKGDFKKAKDAVLAYHQFSMWNDVTDPEATALAAAREYRDDKTWQQAIRIVDLAAEGKLPDITGGATFYFNPKKANPSWAKKMVKTVSIGNHDFYKPRKMVKKKMPVSIREMIESQDPDQSVIFPKGLVDDGMWAYELRSPKSYVRYRHEPDTKTFYLDNVGTPNQQDQNKGYSKALLETFFRLIKQHGGALDSGTYTGSGMAYVKHVVERLSKQYGVRLVKGRDPIHESRFPAVRTKDGRIFIGRIHADAVAKTGDADLASVGWWSDGMYYPEEVARKKWGAASTDDLEPELKRAWRLHQKVPGIGDDPVNINEDLYEYFYHATIPEALPGIVTHGLKPSEDPHWGGDLGASSVGKVFVTTKFRTANYYGNVLWRENPKRYKPILRFKYNKHRLIPDKQTADDFYVEYPLKARFEIFVYSEDTKTDPGNRREDVYFKEHSGQWRPLTRELASDIMHGEWDEAEIDDVDEAYGDKGDHVVFGGVFYPDRVVANIVNSHDSYFGHTRDHGPTRWIYYQGMKTVFWHKFPPAVPEWAVVVKDWLEKHGYQVDRQTDKENYYKLMAWYQKRGLLKEMEDSGVILGALDKNGSNLQPVYSADELANHPSYMKATDRRWRYYPELEQLDWQGQPTPEEHEGTKEFLAQRGLMVKRVHYLAGSTKTAGK